MLTNLKRCVFFLPVPNTHRTHTIGRGRWAGPRHRAGPRHHSGRAEQGAGQGARSAAAARCMSAPTRPASINSWQLGGRTSAAAEMFDERTSRYRQVRLVVNGQVLLSDTLYIRKMMRAHESESAREHMRARARARARENELLDRDRETERECV